MRLFAAKVRDLPTIVISHYHSDHISHLEPLGKLMSGPSMTQAKGRPAKIWMPRIDKHSMNLYLQILAFATLFRHRKQFIEDRDLTILFAKKGNLADSLRQGFPQSMQVVEVCAGHKDSVGFDEGQCDVYVLSPPDFAISNQPNPLEEDIALIRYLCANAEIRRPIVHTVKQMLREAKRQREFRDLILGHGMKYSSRELASLPARILAIFRGQKPSTSEDDAEVLRRMLAVAIHARYETRISLRARDPMLPSFAIRVLRDWPRRVRDATHLFNVSIAIAFTSAHASDTKTSFLLTGDAHTRLWPCMKGELDKADISTFAAVQVPHHGSEENVEFAAYSFLNPSTFVVSADEYLNWRHPSLILGVAIQETSREGRSGLLYCTNPHANSELCQPGTCRKKNGNAIAAIRVSRNRVEWIMGDRPRRARPCPNVNALRR